MRKSKMPNEERSREGLGVYLQDHYAGGVGALELLEHQSNAHAKDELGPFFAKLRGEVAADHAQLHELMRALDFEPSSVRDTGAWMAEKFSRAKVGLSTGDAKPHLLQALETLYIGITGKRLLWRVLEQTRESLPDLPGFDFVHLENRAIEQAERVEAQRPAAAREAFRRA
jgi:hypothetical protein